VLETSEKEAEWGECSFLLCLAYSNSTIKLFYYTSTRSERIFRLLAKGQYMTRCLTQVQFTILGPRISLITGSTDGHVAIWTLPESLNSLFSISAQKVTRTQKYRAPLAPLEMTWQSRHCIHQSSIKAMTTVVESDKELLIITGGDDNALSISRLSFPASESQDTFSFFSTSHPRAHASAITAITILCQQRHSQDNTIATDVPISHSELLIATSGNDQQLKLWSVHVRISGQATNGIEVSLLQDMYTAVADVSSIGSYSEEENCDDNIAGVRRLRNKLVLCGVGMDMWLIDTQLDHLRKPGDYK